MPHSIPSAIERVLGNLGTFSNATSKNLTDNPRARLEELFDSIFSTVQDSPQNTKFISMMTCARTTFQNQYSSKNFENRYQTDGNAGFGELIGIVLYYIRLQLNCIELFDHHNKNRKLAEDLMSIVEHHLAPLVCNDIFYHDQFISAFKTCDPHCFHQPTTPEQFETEAVYYAEFAFACSGRFHTTAKPKLFQQQFYNEQKEKEKKEKKEGKKPTPRKKTNDFLHFLIDFKTKLSTSSEEEAIEYFERNSPNFDDILITSHDTILMDLQSFLWGYFEMPVTRPLGKYLNRVSTNLIQKVFVPKFPMMTSTEVKKIVNDNFAILRNNLISEGDDLAAVVKHLLDYQNNYATYAKFFSFQPQIEKILWFMMQFWFYYKNTCNIDLLFDIFENLSKKSPVYQQFGAFLQNIITEKGNSFSDPQSRHLMLARNLVATEEATGKINPKLTLLLRSLVSVQEKLPLIRRKLTDEQAALIMAQKQLMAARARIIEKVPQTLTEEKAINDIDRELQIIEAKLVKNRESLEKNINHSLNAPHANQTPKLLCERRNLFLESASNNAKKEHILYNFVWLEKELKKRIANAPWLLKLNKNCYQNLTDIVKLHSIAPGDDKNISYVMNSLQAAAQSLVFPSTYHKFIIELQELVLLTILETKKHCDYSNEYLATIIENSSMDTKLHVSLINKLYAKAMRNELEDAELGKLLMSILKSKESQKKYYYRIHPLYQAVHHSTIFNTQAETQNLRKLVNQVNANPPTTLRRIPFWKRVVKAVRAFVTPIHSKEIINTPIDEFIYDKHLTAFCNARPEDHLKAFFQGVVIPVPPPKGKEWFATKLEKKQEEKPANVITCSTDKELAALSPKGKLFYSTLRAKLTSYLSIQQFVFEVEHSQTTRFTSTTLHINDTRNIRPQSRSASWIACIRTLLPKQMDLFEKQMGITSPLYRQASILSALIAKHVTLLMTSQFDNPALTDQMRDDYIEKLCHALMSQSVPTPEKNDPLLNDWTKKVGSLAQKVVLLEAPDLAQLLEHSDTVSASEDEAMVSPRNNLAQDAHQIDIQGVTTGRTTGTSRRNTQQFTLFTTSSPRRAGLTVSNDSLMDLRGSGGECSGSSNSSSPDLTAEFQSINAVGPT